MTIGKVLSAVSIGFACAVFSFAHVTPVHADNLRVVKRGKVSTLNVPMNRAVVVESDVPFAELSIANATIADISSLSDRTIYVLGKAPGLTTLTILDASGSDVNEVYADAADDVYTQNGQGYIEEQDSAATGWTVGELAGHRLRFVVGTSEIFLTIVENVINEYL